MRLLVTGAAGFLGGRTSALLAERGHDVVAVTRPDGAARALPAAVEPERIDAGDPAIRELVAGRDAVLHFAGIPDPARSREDPARAVRENAGTTLNLLEACLDVGAGLIYPSTVRAAEPPPDPYAQSKRLGELACELHPADATVVRLTSVFGPGQVAREGATGAIAIFAARALEGEPLLILGDPERTRDFVYVDDVVPALERIAAEGRWNETITLASGTSTSLARAARMVRDRAGSDSPIERVEAELTPAEETSYVGAPPDPELDFHPRDLEEGIGAYVDWLGRHPSAQGRS